MASDYIDRVVYRRIIHYYNLIRSSRLLAYAVKLGADICGAVIGA